MCVYMCVREREGQGLFSWGQDVVGGQEITLGDALGDQGDSVCGVCVCVCMRERTERDRETGEGEKKRVGERRDRGGDRDRGGGET